MKSLSCIIVIAFFLLCQIESLAQISNVKWGKPNKSDITISECLFEKDADAIILDHQGYLTFTNGIVSIKHIKRIKILKDNGLDQADIEIPYFAKDNLEDINTVKAQTLNVGANGKLEKIKVESNKIYTVDINENWKAKRFTFPAAKVGSIIEYSYTMISKNYTFLDGWLFQSEIPTLRSKFTAMVPETLDYRILFEGRRILTKYGNIKSSHIWELEKIPSIKDEPHVAQYMDYAEKIRFQLAGYQSGNGRVTVMTTWEKLAEERLKDDNYRTYLNKINREKEFANSLISAEDSDLDKAKKIYNYVIKNFDWNGENRMFTAQTYNNFTSSRNGNSAEINLYLTVLLQSIGLKADPVLLSTRRHGTISKSYPFLSQFNYLAVNVNIDGSDHMIDATDPLRPFELISKKCLNDEGYLLHIDNPRWIAIAPDRNAFETTFVDARLNEEGQIEFNINKKFHGYYGFEKRREFLNDPVLQKLNNDLEKNEFIVNSFEISNLEDIYGELAIDLNVVYDHDVKESDLIYFPPVLLHNHSENPFKSDHRQYPIDFSYVFKEIYIIVFEIPEGFELSSIPEPANISLPNKAGRFLLLTEKKGRVFKLSMNFSINETKIPAIQYHNLKEFYNLVVAKFSENIVLKRI